MAGYEGSQNDSGTFARTKKTPEFICLQNLQFYFMCLLDSLGKILEKVPIFQVLKLRSKNN